MVKVVMVLWIDEVDDAQAVKDIVQFCEEQHIVANGAVEDVDGNVINTILNNSVVASLQIKPSDEGVHFCTCGHSNKAHASDGVTACLVSVCPCTHYTAVV